MTLTPRNGTTRWALSLVGALVAAGLIGWVAAVQATRDYAIRDEERTASQERRLESIERQQQRYIEYMQRIDQRLSRIEGKLGIP